MTIYSMTATFGKLSHQTLSLEPGLNIIDAPNEWGKSTWCAFLVSMLYGIDTRQKNTQTLIADKERYAPWSGEPMSGRISLCWKGRNITIERSTRGKIPFGEFRAYETDTGLEIPELTAANCGQMLLGVERSVFTRAGFIRLQDMPVTQDDALRRRLNNLVTTGDESGAGDALGKQLRDLKNKCRVNQKGLLPQAEQEQAALRAQLQRHGDLQAEIQQIRNRQTVLEQQIKELENHADALQYQNAQQGMIRIEEAKNACALLEEDLAQMTALCQSLPSQEEAQTALQQGQLLQQQQQEALSRLQQLPPPPAPPQASDSLPSPQQAREDYDRYTAISGKKQGKLPVLYGIFAVVILAVILLSKFMLPVLLIGVAAIIAGGIGVLLYTASQRKKQAALENALLEKYPGIAPGDWVSYTQNNARAQQDYQLALTQYNSLLQDRNAACQGISAEIARYTGSETLENTLAKWESISQQHSELNVKQREKRNADEHLAALLSVATTAPAPVLPDSLTLSQSETENRLKAARFEQKQLQIQLGQCMGQAEAIGQEDVLRAQLNSVSRRIARLEDYYKALELALEAHYQATTSLQRRFAPRISKQAQTYFSRLTAGKYRQLALSDDLSIRASAECEDTMKSTLWRSDGTVDQLYLSLRLAVAGEITPDAPLVLDDALIRFDDQRLKLALELLREEADRKQVILFTCQDREKNILFKE